VAKWMEYRSLLLGEVPSLPKHAVTFWGSPGTFVTSPSHLPLQHATHAPGAERRDSVDQAGSSGRGLAIPKVYPFAL
jgi:hypothetical protein